MNKTMTSIAEAVREGRYLHTRLYTVYPDQAGGETEVRYRGSLVAVVWPHRVMLFARGFYTPTMKAVINAALKGAGLAAYVYQRKFGWRVVDFRDEYGQPNWSGFQHTDVEFEEGMIIGRTVATW